MFANLSIPYPDPALVESLSHWITALLGKPICTIDLILGMLYAVAALALLCHRHGWLLLIYAAVAATHIGAALVLGFVHP